MTLKRSSKRFKISTEAPNNKGFRVRTSGIDIGPYALNPLMLWMHQRPKGESREEILPLGNFLDVEIENGEVYGVPAFDMTDTFAVSIYNKVENGTIRMASAGLLPIDWERDVEGNLWLSKSQLVETTICDIGSNPEALAVKLYDENDEAINLSADYFQQLNLATKTKSDMKLIELKAEELFPLLGLADTAKADEAFKKIGELVTLTTTQSNQLKKLQSDKDATDAQLAEVQEKLDEQISLANTAKIKDLVAKAGPEGDKKSRRIKFHCMRNWRLLILTGLRLFWILCLSMNL